VARVVAIAEATIEAKVGMIGATGSDGTGGNFGTIRIDTEMNGGATHEATFHPTTLSLASRLAFAAAG
jgi:hypothetical protein